ncbi:Ger(x)C family spore germination protein [Halobacillus mangrovi]|uniref:Spore gernimation protein n=1 Tax=Halobacillus mangrovi TaxID=402384 RepID=A0A1W5ZXW6_9BACI|nr:Ger(x)C family spore germination protein [Halobacillus mangrovi]ARI78195.1 spore gernimation protein [Halobacillus mangrovi]
MNKNWFYIVLCLVLLTGCWDQRQFKDIKLVLAIGFDKNENGGIQETVTIPTIQRSTDGPASELIKVVTTSGDTPREARDYTDQMVAESFDPSKSKVILLGEDLAKDSIQPVFDQFYRNPNNNLNAYIAVIEGKAEDAIRLSPENETSFSSYASGLLEGLVTSTHSTGENIETLHGELLEPGVDFAVPLLRVDEERELLNFIGLALFHKDKYSGEYIPAHHTSLLMLLEGKRGRVTNITEKVTDEEENHVRNYITVKVMKNEHDIKVKVEGDQVTANINLNLKVRVVEYPRNHLTDKKTIKELNKKLSEILTEDSKEVLATIQEANSDVFYIGRKLQAYHPEYWNKVKWGEEFPNINIVPNVKVKIVQYGVIS